MKLFNYTALMLLTLSTAGYATSMQDLKEAATKFSVDFTNLCSTLKDLAQEQANETIDNIKCHVKKENDHVKESMVKLQKNIEEAEKNIQCKLNDVATAQETKDEAKVNALLNEIEIEINAAIQHVKDTAKHMHDDMQCAKHDVKDKFNNNLEKINDSLNEFKSYLRGFRDKIKKEASKAFC